MHSGRAANEDVSLENLLESKYLYLLLFKTPFKGNLLGNCSNYKINLLFYTFNSLFSTKYSILLASKSQLFA